MAQQVDLYNHAYAKVEHDVYRAIRVDTYGRDLGQTSWVSNEESDLIPSLLNLSGHSNVLEIGSGSGVYAIYLAQRIGCHVTGFDLNPHAVASATHAASSSGLGSSVRFEHCDVSQPLPFTDGALDAVFANDVLCHVPHRPALLKEIFRVLRPGARLLFSDALIIGGVLSHSEIATRSSIGPYFFSPPGENERLLSAAGFTVLSVRDTSEQPALIADRWHEARGRRREQLIAIEGIERYEGLQQFLACVAQLTRERRLLRQLYVAEKQA